MATLTLPLLALGLLTVVAVLVAAYLRHRRRGASAAAGTVAVARIAAWLGAVGVALSVIFEVVAVIANQRVTVEVPVQPYWPHFPAISDVTPGHGDLVQREITSVMVTASALGAATRTLLAAGSLVSAASVIAVLAALIVLCSQLLAARPFSGSLVRWGRFAAATLAIGTLCGQTLTGLGAWRTAEETLRVSGYAVTGDFLPPETSPWPEPAFALHYDFAPLVLALAILVIVELVHAGARMARQNEQLRADTDGLV